MPNRTICLPCVSLEKQLKLGIDPPLASHGKQQMTEVSLSRDHPAQLCRLAANKRHSHVSKGHRCNPMTRETVSGSTVGCTCVPFLEVLGAIGMVVFTSCLTRGNPGWWRCGETFWGSEVARPLTTVALFVLFKFEPILIPQGELQDA